MTGPWIHVLQYDNKDLVVAAQWKHQPVPHQRCKKHQEHLFRQNQDDQNLIAEMIFVILFFSRFEKQFFISF